MKKHLKRAGLMIMALWACLAGIAMVIKLYQKVASGHGADQYFAGASGAKIGYAAALITVLTLPVILLGAWLIGRYQRKCEKENG